MPVYSLRRLASNDFPAAGGHASGTRGTTTSEAWENSHYGGGYGVGAGRAIRNQNQRGRDPTGVSAGSGRHGRSSAVRPRSISRSWPLRQLSLGLSRLNCGRSEHTHRARGSAGLLRAWNMLGIADLVVAVTTGFLTSPSPLQLLALDRPNELISSWPLAMIPVFLVPLSLLLHLASLKKLRQVERERRDLKPRAGLIAFAGVSPGNKRPSAPPATAIRQ